jgi:cytochrome c peroxidase
MRLRILTAFAAAGVACGRGAERRTASDTLIVRGGEVVTRPLSKGELARFAVLPTVMAPPQMERTAAQIDLGRVLFYETRLSNGHDVSCNTCHALNGYGADGRKVSFGDVGHAGDRNAPSVYNAAGQVAQFWDGRAPTVEEQAKGPILNSGEMAMPNAEAVLAHMRESAAYRAAFSAAFPNDRTPITYDNVGRAIGAFERGLVTPSRWDRYLAGDTAALSATEQRGLAAFVRLGCVSCHAGPYVGGQIYAKLGAVKRWPTATDSGRYTVTRNAADLFVFKVPSLRNVTKTGPYFHDGSVASLDSAIRLMARHQLGLELSDAQVSDIHSWLNALTGELPGDYIAQPPKP